MPRRKPVKKLDVTGTFDRKPEAAIPELIESKAQDAFFVKPPNWDSAGDSIQLLSVENQREHHAMLLLQDEMRENARRQAEVNEHRTHRLYKMHAHLRKRFIDVNVFIKDSWDKKQFAERKVAQEKAVHLELQGKIDTFRQSIDDLTAFRKQLKATVREYRLYERITDEVIAKSEIFDSAKDCMDRCDALMLAQVEISELNEKKLQELGLMRKKMSELTNAAALTMLGLKNDLAELERSYNDARAASLKWERILANAKRYVNHNDLDKFRALDGILHLYRTLCKRRDIEPLFQRHEVEKQMDFIKDEIELLTEVQQEIEKDQKGGKFKIGSRKGYKC